MTVETTDERYCFVELSMPDVDPGARLPVELEREFRWYLDDPLIAGLMEDDGAFGSQLERAKAFGYGALPCRRCGGTWRSRRRASDGEERITEWLQGTGWKPSRKHFARQSYAQALASYRVRMKREFRIEILSDGGTEEQRAELVATAYRERGAALMTEREFQDAFATLPEEMCDVCDGCSGLGVVPRRGHKHVEVTARPTGSSVGKAGRSPDTMAGVSLPSLFRYQAIDNVFRAVAVACPLHRVALASYYGPRHDSISKISRPHSNKGGRGDIGGFESLWPLTPTGETFLDRGRRRSLDEEQNAIKNFLESTAVSADVRAAMRSDLARECFALYGAACKTAKEAILSVGWEPTEA